MLYVRMCQLEYMTMLKKDSSLKKVYGYYNAGTSWNPD
jgi:hypothetical protein